MKAAAAPPGNRRPLRALHPGDRVLGSLTLLEAKRRRWPRRATGLLTVWADIDPQFASGFNRWCAEEHIPRMLQIPGFLSAGRYRALKGGPKYLTLFEFADAGVPETEAWARARDSNPWTRRMRPNLRHDDGSPGVYRRIWPK